MECKRCHNTNPALFYRDGGIWYCRKCCAFGRLNASEEVRAARLKQKTWKGKPSLEYELTDHQKEASQKALEGLRQGRDVFVYAATGAGKTEMTFASICDYLSRGKKVAFAISRRQVVLEIAQRLSSAFPELDVVPVCEGYTEITDGDIIVCTTHQLYRYPDCFDLLILDELDAFPYVGNEVLETIAQRACRGQKLLLSATPDPESLRRIQDGNMDMVQLFERPHKHPLPVPKVWTMPVWMQLVTALGFCMKMKRLNRQVLIFVPRKRDGILYAALFRPFFRCKAISSESEDKDEIMDAFRSHQTDVLFSTTLLERGITVPSVQIVVLKGEHSVYTTASLIQIFGRAGRSFKDPEGIGLCLCQQVSESVKECVSQIRMMNDTAFPV